MPTLTDLYITDDRITAGRRLMPVTPGKSTVTTSPGLKDTITSPRFQEKGR